MAGRLEKNPSRLIVGLAGTVLAVVLLFAPAAGAQQDDAYPPPSSSTTSSTSTSTTDTSVTPSSVQRSTISRTESGSTTLPRTGNDVLPWLVTGVALVAVGGAIVFLTRRSKATT